MTKDDIIIKFTEIKMPAKIVRDNPRFFVVSKEVYEAIKNSFNDAPKTSHKILEYQGINIYPED